MGLQLKKTKTAFTLIELLVVISIIALLMSVLLPSLARARDISKQVVCMSNLRQMSIAATTYAMANEERFPLAGITENIAGSSYQKHWDFIKTFNGGGIEKCESGILWQGVDATKIQQCPGFKGNANSSGDPYTGYNYNASYLGGMFMRYSAGGTLYGMDSTKVNQVGRPSECVIFGDGEYADGANKFMRSPFVGKLDSSLYSIRAAGTQGFRHNGKTNVAYCDGSAISLDKCYDETYPPFKSQITEGTGFLSADNRAYDLK